MQTLSKDTYKPDQSSGEGGGIAAYLALLGKLRKAGDLEELRYVIVNNSRPTLHYRQAFLLELRASTWRVSCVSSLATFEANAPLIRHIEKVVSRTHDMSKRLDIKINDIDTQSNCATPTSPFESAILQPLLDRDGQCLAVLLCAREKPWREEEAPLLDEVADAASHAWNALRAPQVRKPVFVWKRSRTWIAGLLACLLIAYIPVPMTALAPAEVTAADMVVIAAPIDGVVGELPVAPNSQVKKGQVILRFADTKLRNDAAIADQNRAVARARLHRLIQVTFDSRKDARDIAIARAELNVAEAEHSRANELFRRAVVKAPKDGLLVYSAKEDWIGKPVATGERIMDLVDPAKTELRVDLSVSDAITLRRDGKVIFFPDGDPMDSREAKIVRPGYRASLTADNQLAFRSFGMFTDDIPQVYRIGVRGTAKIYGEQVPLGLYLLRRPIATLRQQVGL